MIEPENPSSGLDATGDGQEAAGDRPPVASASTVVVPLPTRRTYLDACREQGVFQEREELRAELFETRSEIAAKREEMRRERPEAYEPPKLEIVGSPTLEPATAEQAAVARMKAICENYISAGLGDAHFPLLMCLLFKVPITARETQGLFQAALSDEARSAGHHPDHDLYRLNGEGLNGEVTRGASQ